MARDLFATLDLNLLKTLSVLAQENNMRRASERLHVTQPAVSQALKKLRHHFGDELFVKTPAGMRPTSFTVDLMEKVMPILDELSETLNEGETFDPAMVDHPIRIALAPHMAGFLSAGLFRAIRGEAPDVEVHLDNWNTESLVDIAKGEFLLGVTVPLEAPQREIETRELADDRYTLWVREGHPRFGNRRALSLEDLDGVEIAVLLVPGFNVREAHIERVMRANRLRARVGFRSAQPAAVTAVLRASDMIYGASSYIDPRDLSGLKALEIKVNNRHLNYPVTAYFHRRNRNSPLLDWLLGLIREQLEKGA